MALGTVALYILEMPRGKADLWSGRKKGKQRESKGGEREKGKRRREKRKKEGRRGKGGREEGEGNGRNKEMRTHIWLPLLKRLSPLL